MAYFVGKPLTPTDTSKIVVFTAPALNAIMVEVLFAALENTTIGVFIRSADGATDVPICQNIGIDAGQTKNFTTLVLMDGQSLVIQGKGTSVLVTGAGYRKPSITTLPQGQMYTLGVNMGNQRTRQLDLGPLGGTLYTFAELDIFMSVPPGALGGNYKVWRSTVVTLPPPAADISLMGRIQASGAMTSYRKLMTNARYLTFTFDVDNVSLYLQYNIRKVS